MIHDTRSLLVNALGKMVCYMYMICSISLITKSCTARFYMSIMTTLQLDTLHKLPPMNLSTKTTGGQECKKQLLHIGQIVIPVQESNLYVMHHMYFSSLYKSLLLSGVLYPWILLQTSRNLVPNSIMLSLQ